MKKIKASGLDRLFAAISETKELYLPVRGEKDVSYKLWSEGTEYAADALNTAEREPLRDEDHRGRKKDRPH